MRRHKLNKLILFTLFIYCGQTLALPLLSCCDFMGQLPDHSMLQDHGDSALHMNHDAHQMPMNAIHNDDQILSDNVSGFDETTYKYHCDFCVLSSTALAETEVFSQAVRTKGKISLSNLPFLSKPSDNPFKPPITA